jgi:hypothetical protein
MAKIHKKKKKVKKKVDKKLKWLSKPTTYTPTHKLDGRYKEGADAGVMSKSKPLLPLKPMSESRLNEQISNIQKIKESKKGAAWKRPKVKKTK